MLRSEGDAFAKVEAVAPKLGHFSNSILSGCDKHFGAANPRNKGKYDLFKVATFVEDSRWRCRCRRRNHRATGVCRLRRRRFDGNGQLVAQFVDEKLNGRPRDGKQPDERSRDDADDVDQYGAAHDDNGFGRTL